MDIREHNILLFNLCLYRRYNRTPSISPATPTDPPTEEAIITAGSPFAVGDGSNFGDASSRPIKRVKDISWTNSLF